MRIVPGAMLVLFYVEWVKSQDHYQGESVGPKTWWSRQLTGGHKTGPRHGHVCQEVS